MPGLAERAEEPEPSSADGSDDGSDGGGDGGGDRWSLDRLTTEEAAGVVAGAVLLVPLGATEQHGPHLPLGTDTDIAIAWAHLVAAGLGRHGRAAIVAPALPYGSSGEHQAFPGTLSIGRQALELVLVELVRSASGRFGRVALLSGHAGNLDAVAAAVALLRAEGHDVRHFVPVWPGATGPPIDAHAGRTETSLMLHLAPDLVRRDRAEAGDTRPLAELLARLTESGVEAVSPNGVLGDPTGAAADEGRALLHDLAARTVAELRR